MAIRLDPWRNIIDFGFDFEEEEEFGRPWVVLVNFDYNFATLGRPTYLLTSFSTSGPSGNKTVVASPGGLFLRYAGAQEAAPVGCFRAAYALPSLGDTLGQETVWIAMQFVKFYASEAAQLAAVLSGTVSLKVYLSEAPVDLNDLTQVFDSGSLKGFTNPFPYEEAAIIDGSFSFAHSAGNPNDSTGAVRRFYIQIPINVITGEVGAYEFIGRVDV
jgi:hypothetical protein